MAPEWVEAALSKVAAGVGAKAADMAPVRVEAAESAVAAWVGAATVAVTRTKAASDQSSEGTRTAWVGASMGVARAAVAVAVGAEAKVSGMAAEVTGTPEVTMGYATRTREAKGAAGTEGP